MVSLCVMGWGLVLLENSSVAAVAVAAVAAVTQGGPLPQNLIISQYE